MTLAVLGGTQVPEDPVLPRPLQGAHGQEPRAVHERVQTVETLGVPKRLTGSEVLFDQRVHASAAPLDPDQLHLERIEIKLLNAFRHLRRVGVPTSEFVRNLGRPHVAPVGVLGYIEAVR